MAERLSHKESSESYLWGAATLLRGLIDAGDYKQYIIPTALLQATPREVRKGDYDRSASNCHLKDEGLRHRNPPTTASPFPRVPRWKDVARRLASA